MKLVYREREKKKIKINDNNERKIKENYFCNFSLNETFHVHINIKMQNEYIQNDGLK